MSNDSKPKQEMVQEAQRELDRYFQTPEYRESRHGHAESVLAAIQRHRLATMGVQR